MSIASENSEEASSPDGSAWLDLRRMGQAYATSQDSQHPIESAFEEDGVGWRASDRGRQIIRVFFDRPQRIRRIQLQFIELEVERTQQFTLRWSKKLTNALRPLFEERWNFSPSGSTSQLVDKEVELDGVWSFQLDIDPDILWGQGVASLASWRFT